MIVKAGSCEDSLKIGFWVLFLMLGLAGPINADGNNKGLEKKIASANFRKLIAGTYLVSRDPQEGVSRILTIFADGNLSSIQSIQFEGGAGGFAFSDQQGTWKRTGKRKIKAAVLNLDFINGEFNGTALASYSLEFSNHYQTVKGEVEGKIYEPGVNPHKTGNAQPIATFTDQFVGERLMVTADD